MGPRVFIDRPVFARVIALLISLIGLLCMALTSASSGQGAITVAFQTGTGIDKAQMDVQNKLTLDNSASPRMCAGRASRCGSRAPASLRSCSPADPTCWLPNSRLLSLRRQELDNLAALYAALGRGLPPAG